MEMNNNDWGPVDGPPMDMQDSLMDIVKSEDISNGFNNEIPSGE